MEGTVSVAAGISPASQIPDLEQSINAFIAEIRADGTLDDMFRRWVTDSDLTIPDIDMPADPKLHIVVGTSGIVPPFSFYAGDALSGYDIEMARRFAAWMDADVSFKVYDYGSIIIAAATGDVDLIMANLNVTPERAEALTFSDAFYTLPVGIMVKGDPKPDAAGGFTSLDQLDGRRIGVQTGTTAADITLARLPHAQISYFSTFPDMAVALKARKIDGFPGDGLVLRQMAHEDPSLRLLDEKLRSYDCGFVLPKDEKGEALCAEMNTWIKDMRERGELDRILKKWTEAPEAERTVPDYKSLPAPRGVLTMTTEGTFPPMNYYRGDECVGMEIELCALFCEANGYGLNVTTMDFDGMLAAVQARKVDFAISGIAITEERKESVLFSDPYYTGGTMMAVLGSDANAQADGDLPSLERLSGRRIGVQTGTISGEVAQSVLPDIEVGYYNTQTDCMAALRTQKVDFWATDEPIARFMLISNDDLQIAGSFDSSAIAAVFPKSDAGQALRDQYSAFVDELWENGTMDKIDGVWFGTDEDKKIVQDYETLPDTNGTLRMAADTTLPPFVYVKDNRPVGYDVDIAARFCAANGYRLEVVPMDFGGVLPAVQTGKCDFAACCITVTEERAQSVLFSALDPTMVGEVQAVIRDLSKTGKTLMIVTHEMAFARAICNRVFYMDEGGICEDGTPEQVFDHPLRESTRRFVRRLKVLELNIESRDYDFLGMAGEIMNYCNRNQIAPKLANRIQLAFEETARLLVPALENPRVQAVCAYSEQAERAEWTFRYAAPRMDLTRSDDALALAVLTGVTEEFQYAWHEGDALPNALHMQVRHN